MSTVDRSRLRTLKFYPLDTDTSLLGVLINRLGWDGFRDLSKLERVAIAVAATNPKYHLTLTSQMTDRADFVNAFENFREHMMRVIKQPDRPLIYIGTIAQGTGSHGYWHGHFLLWKRFDAVDLREHAQAVGLGKMLRVEYIKPTLPDRMRVTAYAMAQSESVLTSGKQSNRPLGKYLPSYIRPHDKTLEEHHPNLFRALRMANDQCLSDRMLIANLSILDIGKNTPKIGTSRIRQEKAESLAICPEWEHAQRSRPLDWCLDSMRVTMPAARTSEMAQGRPERPSNEFRYMTTSVSLGSPIAHITELLSRQPAIWDRDRNRPAG